MPIITHLHFERFPYIKLSDDYKVMRVHYNFKRTDFDEREPGLDVAFFINLETLNIKYFNFKGSLNAQESQGDNLLKYHHYFLTDLCSFRSTHCLVKRKLRKDRVIKRVNYQHVHDTDYLKNVEVVNLNLQSMTLGTQVVSRIDQNDNFITLESYQTSNDLIYHQIKNIDYLNQGVQTGQTYLRKDYQFMTYERYDLAKAMVLNHQEKAARYVLTSARNKKKLINVKLLRNEPPKISINSQDKHTLFQTNFESKSSLLFESKFHSIIKVAGDMYLILNKVLRQSQYFTTNMQFLNGHHLLTAYYDSQTQFKNDIEQYINKSESEQNSFFFHKITVLGINLVFMEYIIDQGFLSVFIDPTKFQDINELYIWYYFRIISKSQYQSKQNDLCTNDKQLYLQIKDNNNQSDDRIMAKIYKLGFSVYHKSIDVSMHREQADLVGLVKLKSLKIKKGFNKNLWQEVNIRNDIVENHQRVNGLFYYSLDFYSFVSKITEIECLTLTCSNFNTCKTLEDFAGLKAVFFGVYNHPVKRKYGCVPENQKNSLKLIFLDLNAKLIKVLVHELDDQEIDRDIHTSDILGMPNDHSIIIQIQAKPKFETPDQEEQETNEQYGEGWENYLCQKFLIWDFNTGKVEKITCLRESLYFLDVKFFKIKDDGYYFFSKIINTRRDAIRENVVSGYNIYKLNFKAYGNCYNMSIEDGISKRAKINLNTSHDSKSSSYYITDKKILHRNAVCYDSYSELVYLKKDIIINFTCLPDYEEYSSLCPITQDLNTHATWSIDTNFNRRKRNEGFNQNDSDWKESFKLGGFDDKNRTLYSLTIVWSNYDEANMNLLVLVVDKIKNKVHLIVGDGSQEYVKWTLSVDFLCNITHFVEVKFETGAKFYSKNSDGNKNF